MGDDERSAQILADLQSQLLQSRQQQDRLKEALTRVFSLLDDAGAT